MELNIQTYQELAEKYLKYQFALYPMKFDATPELQIAIMQSHQSNTDTMFSLREIIALKNVNDVYCLSRSMFESVVNMGVLVTDKIKDGAKRFLGFQYVEACRILDHLKQIDPEFASKVYDPEEVNAIIAGRNAFVSKYGNVGDWCGLNLIERVRLIDESFPPTCSTTKFFEYFYCQVYRKGSGATHRTSTGLGRSIVWTKSMVGDLIFIEPTPNMNHLVFASIHSLIVYLASIRFIGQILKGNETESYYQKETACIIAGKE
ncbi:MAG: hypothetical protein E3J75_02035 [Dehalococcoidia bacterium]|nr:MAG: hypothetical protein E3J75_02035 [Dehalococcoidia bacterium]